MDLVFSNSVFTNYLMGIPKETRDKVFLNMSELKTVKIRDAIRQIGGLTRVNIKRLSRQELKKYKRNNSRSYKAKPLSRKKDYKKSHSNQENSTDSLVATNSSNSSEEEHSSSDIKSTDKENCLSSPESVETSLSKEDSISRIQEERELKPDNKEEISVSSPDSVLSLEINIHDNKKKTEETSSLTDKHSDETKSRNSDLNTNNTSQSQTTKESTSYKINQNKVDSNKDNNKIYKPINTIPAHDKQKQKIINLFGDDEEIEIKIPSHKKTDTEENTKSDNTSDESSKMKKTTACENNHEKNIKRTQSLGKDNSAKTDVSKKESTARRKSTHHREESNEEDKKRTQSKSRDKDVSNVTETKLVRSSSKTKHSRDVSEVKSKSLDKDISNDPEAIPSSSKTKDRDEIKARRKSINHREESKEKIKSRSKSRDKDVSNSTSVETCSKTKHSGKEVMARRKSIHRREESKDKETTRLRSKSRENDSEKEKKKSKAQDAEKVSSKSSSAKLDKRQSICQTNDSNEGNSKKEKNKSKTQEDTSSKSDKARSKRDEKEVKSLKSHNKDDVLSKTRSLKVSDKTCSEDKHINNKNALKIVGRRKTVSHPVPVDIGSDTNSDSSSDGPIIIIRKKSSTKKDVPSKPQTPKRRKSICNEPKFTNTSDDSRIKNSSDKTKQKAKDDKKNDSLKKDISGEEIKRSQSRAQEGKKSNSNVSKHDKVLKKSSSSNEIICKDSKKSFNEKRRCSEDVSSTRDRSVGSKRSSSATTSSSISQNPSKLNIQDKSSSSNTTGKRSKSTNQETSNSRSSSTTSINKTSSSKLNLNQDESSLNKKRKSVSQETRDNSKKISSASINRSSSSSKLSLLTDESSNSNTSLIKRKKSANQEETPNSSRNSSKVRNVKRDSSAEKNTQQKSNTVVRTNSACNEKSSSDKNSCKTHKSAEKSEQKNKEDKKKASTRTPTRRKSVCIPKPEIITDTSSDSTVIMDDLSNSQTPKRSKTSSELESDSSSNDNLDAVKRRIFSSIAVKASSLTRPTDAKKVKATTPKKSSIAKEKSSTPKSSSVKDKPVPRKITKRRITVHQDNIEEELERIFDNSTPKRTKKQNTTMRKRSASVCILPQCQETENNGVKRKRSPVEVIYSSEDSSNSVGTSNKQTKSTETPSTPTKNYLSYGDLEEQMKTTPSTSKALDFVDPLSGSSCGFSKPNYDDDKTQDMTYDSVLIIEEKENTLPKILVRRKSVQDIEETRKRIISRRHSIHLDDIQFKVEPKDSDEEARESTKQNTAEKSSKVSSKPNIKPKRIQVRRKSIHEISTQIQSPNDVRPIKSILKKRPSDSNDTLPKGDSNISNPSRTQVDLNDNITSTGSVPVRIDLQSIDIDKMFPTENPENAITLEISSEENSPTREKDSSKSRLSVDSAICVESDIDKEAEARSNVSKPKNNQKSENLVKMKIEVLEEIRFITTEQAVESVKDNFVSLLYIYKQYFRMRIRVEKGGEPNLEVRMTYFSKRRDSDLSKMYEKLTMFKVDNFIIEKFFELIAIYLKEEFKEYQEITDAVIYHFMQAIIHTLTENFTSPSDEKFLFNHITSCDCAVYQLEIADKYLKNERALDKKINRIFKDFTFKNSLDKLGPKQTETITRPSETTRNATVASSSVTEDTVCSNTLKTITTESTITKSCVEKPVPAKCRESSSTVYDCGQITVPPSKSVCPPITQQIKNLSLPIIETEDKSSMKPNPPPKRRGRPPKNLQNIHPKSAPKKTTERKVTSNTNTTRPEMSKPFVQKPGIHKPIGQKSPSPDFAGILSQINQTKSFLPSISKTPPNVMITVSSEEYLPNTSTADTSEAVRKLTYTITFDSKSSSQAGLPQQTINEGLENNTQSPKIIPCHSHDQNSSSDVDLHIVEETEEQQVDKTSNSQLTNEIISLLQHPNQKMRSIEPPKQRIITVDGLIVPQSKSGIVTSKTNQKNSNSTVSVSAPIWNPMPAEVPELVTSTSQATNQNITKSTTSVPVPYCTPTTFSNRKLSYDPKQSALPPTFINQNSSQNAPQNLDHGLLKTNNPAPQSTLTTQEQNHPATLKSNFCQNNSYVQNHLRDQNIGQNKPTSNTSHPVPTVVGQNVSPSQKSVNLGHNNLSQTGPNSYSSNQVKTPLYPILIPKKISDLTQNVAHSQVVPVSQNATLEGNVNLGQNISSQSYQTTHRQNNPLGQNLPHISQDKNLGQNDSSQNYQTPPHGQNNPMGQNLTPTSRDNMNLVLKDFLQNYQAPNQRRNSSMGQNLPPTSRDNLNLGQNDSSQNYQRRNSSMGQNLPPALRGNQNLRQNDSSQNYQTPTEKQNTSMFQNMPPSSQGSVNLGQNNLSQIGPNLNDANQRQNRRATERSSSLVNFMAQNGSYMVQNNQSVPVSQHNQSLSQNNPNLTKNNNHSSIHTGSTDSQNNINVLMSQNNKNIPQQSMNHLNPNENDLTRLKTLARVAKSGSPREKNNSPPQKRKIDQNKSPLNNIQEMVRYGTNSARNKNYEQVYQNYLHTQSKKNNHLYELMAQERQQVAQNNLTMAQNVPNNSMGPILQDGQNYITYPHQLAMQSGMMPMHPNQMAPNGYPAQQMAPDGINHQYPYEMVPQIPMYRTHITHAVHEPVYNNLDYMRVNMAREAIAQHDYYNRMMTEMERNAIPPPAYEEHRQAQRLQNDINNRLHAPATLEQITQASVFHQEMAQQNQFAAYSFNHPRSEFQPYQENQRNTESNTLPQPFPSYGSNHSNLTDNHSSRPREGPLSSNSEKYSSSSTQRHQAVSSNCIRQLQDMTDKQIPPLQIPSDPKRPRLVRPNLHQIELLQQNLEQIVANTPPVEKTTNRMNNSALSSTPGQQSYDMDSAHISEGPPQPRPIKWRMKKNLQQDKQKEKGSADENPMQVDVYNPALRNVSRDSGYFSPSDIAMQTLDVDGDHICDRCLAPSSLVCSGCLNNFYCSKECQNLAWPEHMEKCLEVSQLQRRYT